MATREAKKKAKASKRTTAPQVDRRERFVAEYLIDQNATQAAIRAGYSAKAARVTGHRLLTDAAIQAKVKTGQEKIAERLELSTIDIARHLAAIITADPGELIEFRRVCCRYCWGIGNLYQRTPQEMRDARKSYDDGLKESEDPETLAEFDEQGGIGYDARRDPNPECPECYGEGEEKPFPKDTRQLSPAARALYAGIKINAHGGLEVKMHSKEKALELYGRHLGMFKDKLEVEVTDNRADAMKAARERANRR
jgi:phage terminase small subunit